jgi:hypothetical protein
MGYHRPCGILYPARLENSKQKVCSDGRLIQFTAAKGRS